MKRSAFDEYKARMRTREKSRATRREEKLSNDGDVEVRVKRCGLMRDGF